MVIFYELCILNNKYNKRFCKRFPQSLLGDYVFQMHLKTNFKHFFYMWNEHQACTEHIRHRATCKCKWFDILFKSFNQILITFPVCYQVWRYISDVSYLKHSVTVQNMVYFGFLTNRFNLWSTFFYQVSYVMKTGETRLLVINRTFFWLTVGLWK